MALSDKTRNMAHGALGLLLLLVGWEIVGAYRLAGAAWPSLSEIVAFMADRSRVALYGRALAATAEAVFLGYLAGAAVGVAGAALVAIIPATRATTDMTAAVINATPPIALAPLFMVLLGYSAAPAALAALNVFFVIYVSLNAGLRTAPPARHDLFQVFGASRGQILLRLLIPSLVPNFLTGLRMAAPPATIGAILGEWFGAPRGLGVLIVSAMQNFQITLLWGSVILASIVSVVLFAAFGALERLAIRRYGD